MGLEMGGGQWSHRVCEGLVAALVGLHRGWVWGGGWGSGGCPEHPPQKWESKKVARSFLGAVSTQSYPKRWFSSLPWVLNLFVGGLKKGARRARRVPRGLPRGRGTAVPKRSRISMFSPSEGQFLRAYSSAVNDHSYKSSATHLKHQSQPHSSVCVCAEPTPQRRPLAQGSPQSVKKVFAISFRNTFGTPW